MEHLDNTVDIKFSIRNKLIFSFLGISLISLVTISLISYFNGKKMIVEGRGKELYYDAIRVISIIDENLYEAYTDIQIWAKLDIAPQAFDMEDPKFFIDFANMIVLNKGKYDLIVMTDAEGKVYAASSYDSTGGKLNTIKITGMDLSEEPWFAPAIKSTENPVIVTDAHTPKIIKTLFDTDIPVIGFSIVIRDILDDPIGVWTNYYTLDKLNSTLNKLIKKKNTSLISYPLLINNKGKILSTLPLSTSTIITPLKTSISEINILTKEKTSPSYRNGKTWEIGTGVNGNTQITAYAKSPGFHDFKGMEWTLLLSHGFSDALEETHKLRTKLLVNGLCIALISAMIIFLLAKEIVSPIMNMVSIVKKISHGDLSVQTDTSSNDEIGILARAFNNMSRELKTSYEKLEDYNKNLEEKVKKRTRQLEKAHHSALVALADLAEFRDPETGTHLKRIGKYSKIIGEYLVDKKFAETLYLAAPLHDIGKVGIPDRVLLKGGKLEFDEYNLMKSHCILGGRILEEAGTQGKFPACLMARDIAYNHHERYDGNGYPKGLKGEEIPLSARIVSLVDTYDVITTRRIYKKPRSHQEAVDIIKEESGKQFDPEVVKVFLSLEKKFLIINEECRKDTNFQVMKSWVKDIISV